MIDQGNKIIKQEELEEELANTDYTNTLYDVIKFIAGMNKRQMDINININCFQNGEFRFGYHFNADNSTIYGDYTCILKRIGAYKYINYPVENYWIDTDIDSDSFDFNIDIDLTDNENLEVG